MTVKLSEKNNRFYIEFLPPGQKEQPVIFDNNGNGFDIDSGVTYVELGDIPITLRYADYSKMFKGAITVIIQYAEQPAEITVSTLDKKLSKTLTLGGTPGSNDVGLFRLFIK